MKNEYFEWFKLNIKRLKDEKNIKLGSIAVNLGIHRLTLYKYVNGKSPIPHEIIQKFALLYALEIPSGYLIDTNEDQELKDKDYNKLYDKSFNPSEIKYYNTDAMDAGVDIFGDAQEKYVTGYLGLPTFSDCEFAVTISGEDMVPFYKQGDIALCRKVNDRSQINFGDAYFIVTSEIRLIKTIMPCNEENHIILQSVNTDFPSWPIDIRKIDHLYSVKGIIRRKRM